MDRCIPTVPLLARRWKACSSNKPCLLSTTCTRAETSDVISHCSAAYVNNPSIAIVHVPLANLWQARELSGVGFNDSACQSATPLPRQKAKGATLQSTLFSSLFNIASSVRNKVVRGLKSNGINCCCRLTVDQCCFLLLLLLDDQRHQYTEVRMYLEEANTRLKLVVERCDLMTRRANRLAILVVFDRDAT